MNVHDICDNHAPTLNEERRAPRRLRRIAAYFVSFVVLPVLLLCGVELGLRAAGFGYSTHFFLHRSFDGTGFSVTNKAFYQQFFSLPIDDIWEGSEWQTPDLKPPKTCRVFILGSSAAQGWPDPAYSFWRILEEMLVSAYPGIRFEVYSAAHPGVNSHVMRVAGKACARLDPDLFVVYMGNNEVNGPFGAVNANGERAYRSLPLIRAGIAVKDLRLLQLATGNTQKPWRSTLKSVEQFFRLEDPRLGVVTDYFNTNLRDICDAAVENKAGVILATVGANWKDWWPHKSLHSETLAPDRLAEWDRLFQQGKALEEKADWNQALTVYAQAEAIDGEYAELHYRMGRCAFAMEDFAQAQRRFYLAYEQDAFRSRILPQINRKIVETAQQYDDTEVRLADASQELSAQSPNRIPGMEFFIDNCHLTFEGNYVLASSVYKQVLPLLAVRYPGQPAPKKEPISLDECRKRLALTPSVEKEHLRMILNSAMAWKWKIPAVYEQRLAELEREAGSDWVRKNAVAYSEALQNKPQDYYLRIRLVETLLLLGEDKQALDESRILIEYFPFRRDTRRILGVTLDRNGLHDAAVREFETVLQLYPDDAETYLELGRSHQRTGQLDKALEAFRTTLILDPNQEKAKCEEANILKLQGRLLDARQAYREAIRLNPRVSDAYEGLESAFGDQETVDNRIVEWQEVLKEFPESARGWFFLGMDLQKAERLDKAEEAFLKAVSLDPLDAAMQCHLGKVRIQLKQYASALEPLRAALRLNPRIAEAHQDIILALVELGDSPAARIQMDQSRALGIDIPQPLADRLSPLVP